MKACDKRDKRTYSLLRAKEGRKMDERDEYRRPANEDDDGYDPYSDRPADEPEYEEDPWR